LKLLIKYQANKRMGLREHVSTGDGAVFSEDILKIEVHGPNEEHLTIIDVLGIFRTTTQGTTKDDMVMVKDVVRGYIYEISCGHKAQAETLAQLFCSSIISLCDRESFEVRKMGSMS
jgi:predicted RNA-binding protein